MNFDLSFEINLILKNLKKESELQKKRVSAKKKTGYISVLTVLEDTKVEIRFVNDIQKFFPPIKEHSNMIVVTVSDFIRSYGGIESSINEVDKYLSIGLREPIDQEIQYAKMLHGSLIDIKSATSQRHLRTKKSSRPYCVFCWRRVENSKYYCQIHHSSESSSSYYAAQTALISALKAKKPTDFNKYIEISNNPTLKKSLPLHYYEWTASFSPHPAYIIVQLKNKNSLKLSITGTIKQLLELVRENYPITYALIENEALIKLTSWKDFILKSIEYIDPTESFFWEAKDISEWLLLPKPKNKSKEELNAIAKEKSEAELEAELEIKLEENLEQVLLMLVYFFSRHEGVQTINSLPRPRGPSSKKGLVDQITPEKNQS
jgi:hypothetical protein